MSSIPAKVVAMEERACQYQVVVQITNKYRGSFNTLGIRSRNGKNRTLRPSKDSSSLKNAPECDYSSFYGATGTGTPAGLLRRI